jgi:hypothetical protein
VEIQKHRLDNGVLIEPGDAVELKDLSKQLAARLACMAATAVRLDASILESIALDAKHGRLRGVRGRLGVAILESIALDAKHGRLRGVGVLS